MKSKEGDEIFAQIHEALTAALIGDDSGSGLSNLALLLDKSEQARDVYVRYIAESAQLRSHGLSVQQAGADLWAGVDPAVVLELLLEAEVVEKREQRKEDEKALERRRAGELARLAAEVNPHNRRAAVDSSARFMRRSIGLAVCLLVALTSYSFFFSVPAEKEVVAEVEGPVAVATVLGFVDAEMYLVSSSSTQQARAADSSSDRNPVPVHAGLRLQRGSYDFHSGIIKLEFGSGACVIVEAPAKVAFIDISTVALSSGKLVGKVPPEAVGFTVKCPQATVVDLGTEFGLHVSCETQDTQAHVFDGEVSLVPSSKAPRTQQSDESFRLRAGQAAVVDSMGKPVIRAAKTSSFVRELPAVVEYVGVHEGVGAVAQVRAISKPLDVDNDGAYGSSGYYWFNVQERVIGLRPHTPREEMRFRLPPYIAKHGAYDEGIAVAPGVVSVGGGSEYLKIAPPDNPSGNHSSAVISGVLSYMTHKGELGNPQQAGPGTRVKLCSFLLSAPAPPSGFRIGVFTDNADSPGTVPEEIWLRINDREASVVPESDDLDGDIYFFDVERAQAGDVIAIDVRLKKEYASIGGVTFDTKGM